MDYNGYVEDIENFLEEKYGVVLTLYYQKYVNAIKVAGIVVPKEARGQGVGTKVFDDLTSFADKFDLMIVLTPSKDLGGSSVTRLRKFYQRFGFVRNLGRNKDFRTMETMLRPRKSDRK